MPLEKNSDGDYVIKRTKPGYEAVPTGGAIGIDLTGDGNSFGWDGPLEYGFGGSIVVAAYSGILEALNLLPAHRAGLITRKELVEQSLSAAWSETKNKGAYVVVCAVIVTLLPGTAPLFGIASLVGGGVMAWRLVKTFANSLSAEQLETLKNAAAANGVEIPGITDRPTPEEDGGTSPAPAPC